MTNKNDALKFSKTNRRKFIKSSLAIGALSLVDGKTFGQHLAAPEQIGSNYTEPSKNIPVFGSYDVIVVGGGAAGWAAALASARNKARTLVIDRFAVLGGTATTGLMLNINGFRNQMEPQDLQTSKGIAEELILNLQQVGGIGSKTRYRTPGTFSHTKGDLSYSYPIDGERTKYIMLKLLHEAGANILFHTLFVNTIMEGNNVTGIIVENKSGRQAIFGKVVIDATGDADVSYRAGVPYWQAQLDADYVGDRGKNNTLMYRISINPNSISQIDDVIVNNDLLIWGPAAFFDPTNADELSKAEVNARLAVFEHHRRNQQRQSPLLDDAYITEVAPWIGIRQSRFIKGLYTTTGDDALVGARFDDSIAMSGCAIISYYGYRRYLEHTGYEIPYRCLLPQNVEGLIVTGRCISSDQRSYESFRSIAPIMNLGEAAGVAAAISVETGRTPKTVDVQAIRNRLIEQGAEVGQNNKHNPNPALIESVSPASPRRQTQ